PAEPSLFHMPLPLPLRGAALPTAAQLANYSLVVFNDIKDLGGTAPSDGLEAQDVVLTARQSRSRPGKKIGRDFHDRRPAHRAQRERDAPPSLFYTHFHVENYNGISIT